MKTICATVNTRLLTKATRLFTGTLEGRIIEILQNARRAHATRVEITNSDGRVTIRDNGHGIADFAKLLDMGGSGWDEFTEVGEDPAGVGLFCLAPREVSIRSNGNLVSIGGAGWTGAPVKVQDDPNPIKGTILHFWDEPWNSDAVNRLAVFTGMDVIVDGAPCPSEPFVSPNAAHYPDLGCRIEVPAGLSNWHHASKGDSWNRDDVLINFHGQVVAFDYKPVSELGLRYLVDLTGEPTGIRLMLPARTRVVENAAFKQLRAAIEREAFRFLQRRGTHSLEFKEYVRARELGITLPEAKPTFTVGLLRDDVLEPVEVSMSKSFPLSKCCRFDWDAGEFDDPAGANVHLLAALGSFTSPFVPVEIRKAYDGYSWAKLPTVAKVEVHAGAIVQESWVWSGLLAAVDSLSITVTLSDGRVISSPVCMAVMPPEEDGPGCDERVLVTREAQERLRPSEVWFHLGGWSEEGDTLDTQEHDFTQQLEAFWARLLGPCEPLRQSLFGTAQEVDGEWERVHILKNGTVEIHMADGSVQTLLPPAQTDPIRE